MSDSRSVREKRLAKAKAKGKTRSSSEVRAERLAKARGRQAAEDAYRRWTDSGSPGVLGVLGNLGRDLKDAAVNMPTGLIETADSLTSDVVDALHGDTDFERTKELARAIGDQYAHTYGPLFRGEFGEFAHRLGAHPLGPVLDVATALSGGAAAVGKLSAASKASTAAGAAKALVSKAPAGTRTVTVGDLSVRGVYSRNPLARAGQKATDAALTKHAAQKPTGFAAGRLHARASRWEERNRRVEEALARSTATRLQVAGRKLKPEEQMALRLVAEEAPVRRRIAASELRAARSGDTPAAARHRDRITLMQRAAELLDEDANGRPVVKAGNAKLTRVMALLREASTSREEMLSLVGRMSPEGAAKHKTDVGRVALGAEYVDPRAAERQARDAEAAGRREARAVEAQARRDRKQAVREATVARDESDRAAREWFRLATTRGARERQALGDERAIDREVAVRGRPEPVLPIETREIPRTRQDVERRIVALEQWLEPRLGRARDAFQAITRRELGDRPFSGEGPKPTGMREFPLARGPAGIEGVSKGPGEINRRWLQEQEGLRGQRSLGKRLSVGKVNTRAESALYEAGRKAGAHPSLRLIADRMDELDELRQLVQSFERSQVAFLDETFPGWGARTERVSSELPPERSVLLDEDVGAAAAARAAVEREEAAREAAAADARRRADSARARSEAAYARAGDLSAGRREAAARLDDAAARAQQLRARAGAFEGADDFQASADALYVGDPVRRSRLTGRPKASGQVVGRPRLPESLTRGYTGRAKAQALERLDTTQIVAERNLEAVRLTSLLRLRDRLAQAGSTVPRRPDDVFVRLDNAFERRVLQEEMGAAGRLRGGSETPALLRQFLDDPESLTSADPMQAASMVDRIRDHMFDSEWALSGAKIQEFERLAEQGLGVFVPKRLLGSLAKRDPRLQEWIGNRATSVTDAINNAQKAAIIYLEPNYAAPQMLSNMFLVLTRQGFAAPRNLTWAVRLNHRLGDYAGVIDDVMGEGALRMLGGEGEGLLGRSIRVIAGTLSKVVDTPFRRAAWLHEARTAGFTSADRMVELLENPALRDVLKEVTVLANQAIVDFGELSPLERSIVRRVVFVYPWVKGSTMLAGRFLRDHPAQADVYARLAQEAQERSEEELGPVPSYLEGSFAVGGRLVNPASLSPFGTPAQVGQMAAGLVSGRVPTVGEPQQFLAPVPSLALALATRRDSLGRPLAGKSLDEVAFDELVLNTPQSDVVRALIGKPRESRTFPNPEGTDAYWRHLFGGLYPREYNRAVLNANARREQSR